MHIVDNAINFTPIGGAIYLKLGQDEDYVVVEVSDNGRGIPSEHLSHIMELFYKIPSRRSKFRGQLATGLGLAIVKRIVDFHHGLVEIQSQEGVGTTVTVRLKKS